MSLGRPAAWLVAAALGVASAAPAYGAPRPAEQHPLSDYEMESLRIGLEETESEIDPNPGHKWIEAIDTVRLDVIEPRDPAPRFLNLVHATSRSQVIEQEMLLRVGDRFDVAQVEETERNLRALRQLSVVLIVPTKGSTPDRVRLLVVTKDVWSLRLNWDPVFVNGALASLVLQPSEENFLGRHKTLDATVTFGRATYSLGLGFIDPRVAGTRLRAAGSASVIFNCRTGDPEGSVGTFSYGKPLYSSRTKWSWITGAAWSEGIVRPAGTHGQSVCSGDQANPIPGHPDLPYQYRRDVIQGEVSALRSYGSIFKNDVSFGVETDRRVYTPPEPPGQTASDRAIYQDTIPVSDTRISPFVQLHGYQNKFLRVLNLETLGLQEDYQLGHDVWLRAYPALKGLGSSRNLVGIYAGVGYTIPYSDGFTRAFVSSSMQASNPAQSDAEVLTSLRFVTPTLPFGRLVLDGFVVDRFMNYLNPTRALGGTTRLRGYQPLAFLGPNVLVANAEIRTKPIEILHVQFGAVAFYDVGDAFHSFSEMHLRQGAGVGLRLAFPQIQRSVFRIDLGVPLDPHDPYAETTVLAAFQLVGAFEQAFGVPAMVSPGFGQ
jgi:hypothetical protein